MTDPRKKIWTHPDWRPPEPREPEKPKKPLRHRDFNPNIIGAILLAPFLLGNLIVAAIWFVIGSIFKAILPKGKS